jgi:hypothetical protein
LVAEDAGDEQAKSRLLLSDVPAVFDLLGFGLWQESGEPVPDDGIVGHLADATGRLTPGGRHDQLAYVGPGPEASDWKRAARRPRLAVRWERRTELHDAFVSLACPCWRRRPR